MIFTKRTYRHAIYRAMDREIDAFMDHHRGIRGPQAWIEAKDFTDRIKRRRQEQYYRCRTCNHPEFHHKGISGPNSIGQWSRGECVVGSRTVYPYRFGGCACTRYIRPNWWVRLRMK